MIYKAGCLSSLVPFTLVAWKVGMFARDAKVEESEMSISGWVERWGLLAHYYHRRRIF